MPPGYDPASGSFTAPRADSNPEDQGTAPSGNASGLIKSVVELIRDAAVSPGGNNFMIAVDYLNEHYRDTEPGVYKLTDGERTYLLNKLGPKAESGLADLESRKYTIRDSRHIEDCLLLSGIARRVAGDGEDLVRVTRVFDWLIRQVQLVPAGALGPPGLFQAPARPYDVLLRAMATEQNTWMERSWTFLALCRQLDLDAGILMIPRSGTAGASSEPNPSAEAPPSRSADSTSEPATAPPRQVFAVAVLIEGVPYLFDCRIGLPIPGAGGQGVATLQQAMTDPRILDQLDLPGMPYPVHQSDLQQAGKVTVLLDSTLGYLTPRMRQFQNELTGRDRMVLFRDPSEADAAFAQALGAQFGGTEMWSLPIEVETRLFTDPAFVQSAQFALQFFDAQLPLLPARMAQLRGGDQLSRAVESYVAFRFDQNPVMNDGKTPIPPAVQQVLNFYATYYLGLAKLDQGSLKPAKNFFEQTIAQIDHMEAELRKAREEQIKAEIAAGADPNKPRPELTPFFSYYRQGAVSNLGLIAESQGAAARDEALRYLNADLGTGQTHGNRLRARALLWENPFAGGSER